MGVISSKIQGSMWTKPSRIIIWIKTMSIKVYNFNRGNSCSSRRRKRGIVCLNSGRRSRLTKGRYRILWRAIYSKRDREKNKQIDKGKQGLQSILIRS